MQRHCATCVQASKPPAPRQPKKVLGVLEAPEEVAVPEEDKKDPGVKNMEDMHAALLGEPGRSANLLACVVNHASFSQSVENGFALSFLVRRLHPLARAALCRQGRPMRQGRNAALVAAGSSPCCCECISLSAAASASLPALHWACSRRQVNMSDWHPLC